MRPIERLVVLSLLGGVFAMLLSAILIFGYL